MAYDFVSRLGCLSLCSLVFLGLAQAAPLRTVKPVKAEEYYRLDDLIENESDFEELKASPLPRIVAPRPSPPIEPSPVLRAPDTPRTHSVPVVPTTSPAALIPALPITPGLPVAPSSPTPTADLPVVDLEPARQALTIGRKTSTLPEPPRQVAPVEVTDKPLPVSAPAVAPAPLSPSSLDSASVLSEPQAPANLVLPDLDFPSQNQASPNKPPETAAPAAKSSVPDYELKRGKRAPVTEKSTKMIPAIPPDSEKLVIPPPPAFIQKSESQEVLPASDLFKSVLTEALVNYNLSPAMDVKNAEPYAIVAPSAPKFPVEAVASESPSTWSGKLGQLFEQTGFASWYGKFHHGKKTASGLPFNKNALTAAHPTLPLLSFARITNLENGQSAVLQITDRGPYIKGRVLDVSEAAARLLGFLSQGTASVRIEALSGFSRQ